MRNVLEITDSIDKRKKNEKFLVGGCTRGSRKAGHGSKKYGKKVMEINTWISYIPFLTS